MSCVCDNMFCQGILQVRFIIPLSLRITLSIAVTVRVTVVARRLQFIPSFARGGVVDEATLRSKKEDRIREDM